MLHEDEAGRRDIGLKMEEKKGGIFRTDSGLRVSKWCVDRLRVPSGKGGRCPYSKVGLRDHLRRDQKDDS